MMRAAVLAAAFGLWASAAVAATPAVQFTNGDVVYTDASGAAHVLSHDAADMDTAEVGPDGHTVAMIHDDAPNDPRDPTSLWLIDGLTGATRTVIGPRDSADPKTKFESFTGVHFAADGAAVYVTVLTSDQGRTVHAVLLQAGTEHYLIDGMANAVIQDGPYRGDLLVERDIPKSASPDGADVAIYVVSPDGKSLLMVPGSNTGLFNTPDAIGAWLADTGAHSIPSYVPSQSYGPSK